MVTQKLVWTLAPALLLAASTVQASSGSAAEQCIFDKYAVSSVAPFRSEENVGYGTYTRLRGAQLFVPAREGLTAEWLTASVQRALSKHASTPAEAACKPAVPVQVQVISAGSGFWVQLGTSDERAAATLLRWAQSLAPAHASASGAR